MTKYKNPQIEQELLDDTNEQNEIKKLKEPATTPEEETWKTRYGDLRRHQQEREIELKNELDQLRKQMDGIKTGVVRPPKSEAELREWEEQYPDFSDILDSRIEQKIKAATEDLKVQSVEIKKEKALIALRKNHPDCDDIFKTPEFIEWVKDQSDVEQAAIFNPFSTEKDINKRVKNASFVIDKWKQLTKSNSKSDDNDSFDRNGAAKSIKLRSNTDLSEDADLEWEFSESQIDRETKKDEKWWDRNESKILAAQRKGKILLDVTGGAR